MARNVKILVGKEERTFSGITKVLTPKASGRGDYTWVPEADLGTKEISENGTYEADDDNVSGYSKVVVNVPGGAGDLVTKEINENGTYNAQDEQAYGYSSVTVNVGGTLITKEITQNGTYNAIDEQADGYSSVTVDVEGGGGTGPEGIGQIDAIADGDLSAGDTVYIILGSATGEAETVQSVFTASATQVAYDGDFFYFNDPTETAGNRCIYRIPIDDYNDDSEKETYLSGKYELGVGRSFAWYQDEQNGIWKIENLDTGNEIQGDATYSVYYASQEVIFLQNMANRQGGSILEKHFCKISDFEVIEDTGIDGGTTRFPGHTDRYIKSRYQSSVCYYDIYTGQTRNQIVECDTAYQTSGFNIINNKLVAYTRNKNASNKYEVGYFDLDANDGEFHVLQVEGDNLEATHYGSIQYDAASGKLHLTLGNNGLAIVHGDMTVEVVTNICNTSGTAGINRPGELMGDYYYNYQNKVLYKLPSSEATMGRTTDKTHTGKLGYVRNDVDDGEEGTAIILFE